MYVKNPTLLWQNACECLGRTFHIQVWEFCYFYLENFRQRNSKITVHDFWTHHSPAAWVQLFSSLVVLLRPQRNHIVSRVLLKRNEIYQNIRAQSLISFPKSKHAFRSPLRKGQVAAARTWPLIMAGWGRSRGSGMTRGLYGLSPNKSPWSSGQRGSIATQKSEVQLRVR